ncbi:hypothetical protein LguiA_035675 [Lonicera macranthoides]
MEKEIHQWRWRMTETGGGDGDDGNNSGDGSVSEHGNREKNVSAPAGFPDHPHRGFETVTYMLQFKYGAVTHEDFEGHKGTIGAGDLQWMTGGRGIVHSEMPAAYGTQKGLQLWINLSSKHKMMEPCYQEITTKNISEATTEGIRVRIIAGEALGIKSPVYTRTPAMYSDFTLKPEAHLHQPIPKSWNSFVYIIEGSGDGFHSWNKSSKILRFVLVGGEPLGEPVVQLGPFVMNTQQEIDQTIEDYESFSNGFEKARHWRSEGPAGVDS